MRFLLPLIALVATACAAAPSPPTLDLAGIEAASGGRMGIALADRDGRLLAGHRADERFAFASTFKLLLAAMVLDGHAEGLWSLDDRLPLTRADLVAHAPVAEPLVERGWIGVGEAAEAIVTVSDNVAANLLIRKVGGIHAFNAWLRAHGDEVTRLDRMETALNENAPGDPRDTTTPRTMARSAAHAVFGDWLRPAERAQLRHWLVDARTGLSRIRAGLPEGWTAGDKTGTSAAPGQAMYNDVAFIVPPGAAEGEGYILAVYLDRPRAGGELANAHIARVGRAAAEWIAGR